MHSHLFPHFKQAEKFLDFPGLWALTLLAVLLGIITERLIKKGLGRLSHQWIIA
jgi:NitT/TauT family transport system permease protein